jgi:glycosyltransferase involved in cell wall biosynthesis
LESNDHSVSVKALVVGDGEILPSLKQKVEDWQLSQHFVFTGNVPHSDVYGYIQAMDITVMPKSNWYGSPVKIFEYGIMGKLVIAPDNGPVKDAMQHEMDGLLVNETVDGLVFQLNRAIQHPSQSAQMAAHFQNKIRNQFTWQHVADRILEAAK